MLLSISVKGRDFIKKISIILSKMKNILLVNPWIYDFAAYDLWLKPWGLLKISSILKEKGKNVHVVDVLDRHHELIEDPIKDASDGTGKYMFSEVDKPAILKNIPRKYKRYGLSVRQFKNALPDDRPDAVLVSSGMTYWYPGVFYAIKILKEVYPDVKVILGGPYATLARKHAVEKSGADIVIKNFELQKAADMLGPGIDFSFRNILDSQIDYSSYHGTGYAVLRLSLGCPFDCSYCAQKKLSPPFMLKDPDKALEEYVFLSNKGIKIFAFYDDALLYDSVYFERYVKNIISRNDRSVFFTPNGLHARFLSPGIAVLMKKAGFVEPVLSLETAQEDESRKWHNKVTRSEIETAVNNLKYAGYGKGEYMVYLMLGVPGSSIENVSEDIEFVHSLGAKISLSEFSPIPGTAMGEGSGAAMEEPLLQNNSVFPSFNISEWEKVRAVKEKAVKLNRALAVDKN